MHLLAILSFVVIGGSLIALAAAHEYTWFKRRRWTSIKGIVVANIENRSGEGLTYSPEIEYSQDGETRRFVSKYGGSKALAIEESVIITISPTSGIPEWYTPGNRILFTVGPLLLGILFVVVGLNIQP